MARFGIIPNKTKSYTIPNEIKENSNFRHFIRGYFDGDGWFSIINNSKLCWGIYGNISVLQDIQKYIIIKKSPKIYAQKNIFRFEFRNQHDVYKITNYLYNNSENTIIFNFTKNELEDAYKRLKSYKLMSKEFNCAKSTIAKYMKKYNLNKN